jgi:serine/threonine protein kinase
LPSFLSREVMDLLARMLSKNPQTRIGINQIKAHPFFKDIDWDLLALKKIKPYTLLQMESGPVNQIEDEEDLFLA